MRSEDKKQVMLKSNSYYKKKNAEEETNKDQATKSIGWMPWHQAPKKDVAGCEKLRGAASKRYIRRCPNEGTHI